MRRVGVLQSRGFMDDLRFRVVVISSAQTVPRQRGMVERIGTTGSRPALLPAGPVHEGGMSGWCSSKLVFASD